MHPTRGVEALFLCWKDFQLDEGRESFPHFLEGVSDCRGFILRSDPASTAANSRFQEFFEYSDREI